jgi:hypothetical protein
MFIGQFIEFIVAMKRIQKFLLCEEINPTLVRIKEQEHGVSIRNSNFHWGLKNEGNLEDQHKKLIKDRNEKEQLTPSKQQENQSLSNFVALKNLNLQI